MAVEVALAMLHRDGRWLLGTVWRYLDPGETHEQALQRELLEEISWQPPAMELVMVHQVHRRTAHVFRAELAVPLEQLQLLERQDMALVRADDLLAGSIWSARLGTHRPLADGLLEVIQHVLIPQGCPRPSRVIPDCAARLPLRGAADENSRHRG